MTPRLAVLAVAVSALGGCAFIDATEHCVQTRYGKVTEEKVAPGIEGAFFVDHTCFSMTDQNYPEGEAEKEVVDGVTNDKLPVTVDLAVVWRYDPETIYQVFLEKRSPDRVKVELINAIREGARSTLAAWTVDDLIGPKRAELGTEMANQMNVKLGDIAEVAEVYVRNVGLPEQITAQQLARIQAQRERDTAIDIFKRDSINAFNREYQAQVDASIRELQARVYDESPAQLSLDIAKTQAEALAKIFATCQSQCIIGGSVADAFTSGAGLR